MSTLSILPNDNLAGDVPAPPRPPIKAGYQKPTWSYVKVLDLEMSFGNMVVFMIKWAFASIPALIIIFAVTMFLFASFGVLGALGLGALSSGMTPTPTPAHLVR